MDGNILKLAAGDAVSIVKRLSISSTKWFEVSTEYKKKTYKGLCYG